MSAVRKDYAIRQGLDFIRSWRIESADLTEWDFRFSIYNVNASDVVKTVGSGITFDPATAPEWSIIIDTAAMPVGSYRYTHDYNHPDGGWAEVSTGEFRITDPKVLA